MASTTPVKRVAIANLLGTGRALIDGLRDGKEQVDPARFCSQSRLVIVAGKETALTTVTRRGLLPECYLVVVSPHLRQFNSRLWPRKIMNQETNNARFGT